MVPRSLVSGQLVLPNGIGAPGGTIECRLSARGVAQDAANSQNVVVSGAVVAPIASDGTVNVALVANSRITPTGTYYLVRIDVPGQPTLEEAVIVPDADCVLAELLPSSGGGSTGVVANAESIRGTPVAPLAPQDGQVLEFVSAASRIEWRYLTPPVRTSATLPAASADLLGRHFLVQDSGAPMQEVVCLAASDGSYGWASVAIAGPATT